MPRYFFHLADGSREPDQEGVDLRDHDEAREEALKLAGAVMSERCKAIWSDGALEVSVEDKMGLKLFMVTVIVTNSEAAPSAPRS